MMKTIDGSTLRKMMLAGAAQLEDNKKYIDSLNVFPVPDGDTGTNMSMTMQSVVRALANCSGEDISELCDKISNGALRGARGNSGVILSQILKGMCLVLKNEREINIKVLSAAIVKGEEIAYKAVTKPKEGTILTVIAAMAEASKKISRRNIGIDEFLNQVINVGEEALRRTPDLLPVLKKAGVVDSGGQGLMTIFAGFYKAVSNDDKFVLKIEQVEATPESISINQEVFFENVADIVYGYCTEYMIIEIKKKTTLADIEKLKNRLMEIGDSVLCLGDLNMIKVHVHTNEPNRALAMALELGELDAIKIENMREENRVIKRNAKKQKPMKEYGIVSVCAGDGITAVFKEVGVDYCIEGGQTMNPSSDDIAKAINEVNAKNVFVLPNNKNIIMAAKQTPDLVKKGINVIVIESSNIPQGISACIRFNSEASVEENTREMESAIESVRSGSVTYSIKDTHISGLDIEKGDIIGLDEHDIITKGKYLEDVVEDLISKLNNDDATSITLFYGDEVNADDAEDFCEKLKEKYEDKDINVIPGGQPVYYYLISIE